MSPADLSDPVARDPDVMNGTPVFRGTRVPVRNLTDYFAAGDGLDAFLADFPTVRREQAEACRPAAPAAGAARPA